MSAHEDFEINIRDPEGRSVLIRVSPHWTVRHVKEAFARQAHMAVEGFRLVFAGHRLDDSSKLEEFGLQSYSTIHCIRGRSIVAEAAAPSQASVRDVEAKLARMEVESGSQGEEAFASKDEKEQYRFFVYCKRPCSKMTKGKLRVRCADCRDPAFELHSDPQGWEDVLTPRRLRGQCCSPRCQGVKYAEFYFRCAEHEQRDGMEDQCVALHMVRVNTVKAPCASCLDDEQQLVVVFDCQNKHVLCTECFVDYIRNALQERNFREHGRHGYTLQCPAHCEDSYISEIHHFRLLTPDEYDRYQRFGAEECLLQMGGVLCPGPDCGMGILPDGNLGNRIQCTECRLVFCKECKAEYHRGPCSIAPPAQHTASQQGQSSFNPQHLERARWDQASRQYFTENIKKCPRCRYDIDKDGGCMHMTCSNCRHEFCWICLVPWNRNCQSRHWFGER